MNGGQPRLEIPWLFPAVVCAIVVVAAGSPLLKPNRSLVPESELDLLPDTLQTVTRSRDATPAVLDLPRETMVARGLREGRWPTWNSHVGAGTLLWADQGGPFFPLKWLFYAAPSRWTFHFALLSRVALAFAGVWLLARRIGLTREASVVAAAIFSSSGIVLSHSAFLTTSSQFLLPWCALAGIWAVRREHGAAPILFVALNFLGGHPTLTALGLILFALTMAFEVARQRAWLRLVDAGVVVALGAAIAAVALLPFSDFLRHGVSYKGTYDAIELAASQLHYVRKGFSLATALPTLVNTPDGGIVTWPIAAMCVLSAPATVLTFASVREWRRRPLPGLIALIGVILCLRFKPFDFLNAISPFRDISPLYSLSLVALGAALCGGLGVDELRRRPRVPLITGLVAWVIILAVGVQQWWDHQHQLVWKDAYPLTALALVPIALAAATFGWRGHAAVLVACVLFEPYAAILPTRGYPSTERLYTTQPIRPERVPLTADGRFYSQSFETLFPNGAGLTGLYDFRVCSPIVPARYSRYLDTMGGYRGTYVVPFSPTVSALGLGGVTQVNAGGTWQRIPAVARARMVHDVAFVTSTEEALQTTKTLLGSEQWMTTAAIEDEKRPVLLATRKEPVTLYAIDEEHLVVSVDASTPGYLVLNDTLYPGWEARLDGTPVSIAAANVAFRAVWVPAGTHAVDFQFHSPATRWGWLITLGGLAGALVFAKLRSRR